MARSELPAGCRRQRAAKRRPCGHLRTTLVPAGVLAVVRSLPYTSRGYETPYTGMVPIHSGEGALVGPCGHGAASLVSRGTPDRGRHFLQGSWARWRVCLVAPAALNSRE